MFNRMTVFLYSVLLFPQIAMAANFEATIQSLVSSFVGRILPILALGYVGKNIFSHIQGNPDARRESVQVAIAVVALLGIQGVWTWLKAQVR